MLAPRFHEGEPPEFLLPFGNLTAGERADYNNAYRVVARLAEGVTLEQAASRIAPILSGGQGRDQRTSRLATIPDDHFGPRGRRATLFGASVLLLLIAAPTSPACCLATSVRGTTRWPFAVRLVAHGGAWRVRC